MARRLGLLFVAVIATLISPGCGSPDGTPSATVKSTAMYVTPESTTARTPPTTTSAATVPGAFSATIQVGAFPKDLWLAQRDSKLYVTNSGGSGSITVIDTKTNRAIATFMADRDTRRIVGTSDGKTVYVTTNPSDHPILAIATATGNVLARIVVGDDPLGAMPSAMAVDDKDGILYVATEYGTSFVAKVDIASNRIVAKIPIRWSAADIVFDAEHNRAYVSSGHAVLVVDGASNTITATIPMKAETGRLAFDPATNNLYVNVSSSKSLEIIDTSTNVITAPIELPSQPSAVAVDSAGHRLYITASVAHPSGVSTGEIHVVDSTTGKLLETVSAGDLSIGGLSFDPASHRVYVLAGSQDSIITFERPSR